MTKAVFLLPAALLLAATSTTARASSLRENVTPTLQAAELTAEQWLALRFQGGGRDLTRERVRDQALQMVRERDVDGNGLTKEDDDARIRIRIAEMRASRIAAILRYDLDGDGVVTAAEVGVVVGPQASRPLRTESATVEPTEEQRRTIHERLVARVMAADKDGDGRITVPEISGAATPQDEDRMMQGAFRSQRSEVPPAFDLNGDGRITLEETGQAVDRAYAALDTDGNDTLSEEELTAARASGQAVMRQAQEVAMLERQRAESRKALAACGFRPAAGNEKVVVFGAYEGAALSNAAIGDDSNTIYVANVVVEPGDEPLYVVLTSYSPMIWQFKGAVDRVQGVMVSTLTTESGKATAGVTGLKKGIATFAGAGCRMPSMSKPNSRETMDVRRAVEAFSGRQPSTIGAVYTAWTVHLPAATHEKLPYSDTVSTPDKGLAAGIWQDMYRFNPGGLVAVDTDKVSASAPVRPFSVLPEQAGLAQLVEQGVLEVEGMQTAVQLPNGPTVLLGDGDDAIRSGRPLPSYRTPSSYRITRKMRFPAGLSGAHSVTFILGKGVPAPEGNPGHSCVISEETGAQIAGLVCR